MADPDIVAKTRAGAEATGAPVHRAERVHPPPAGRGARRTPAGSARASPVKPSRRRRPGRGDALGPGRRWRAGRHRARRAVRGARPRRRAVGARPPPRRSAGRGRARPGQRTATRRGSTTRRGGWAASACASSSVGRPPVDDVLAAGADVVAVATGAIARRPDVPGVDLPHVVTISEALTGTVELGPDVVVVAEDDGPAPLSVADHLAGLRPPRHARLPDGWPGAARRQVLGRSDVRPPDRRRRDARAAGPPRRGRGGRGASGVHLRPSVDGRSRASTTSCWPAARSRPTGSTSQLKHRHPDVHLLGDAYAPRRMVFATRQAWALAGVIDQGAPTPVPVALRD